MKFLNKVWGIGLLACMLIMAAPQKSTAQNYYISDQDFYDSLSPYGIWVYDPQYGDVWVPDVQDNFRPYATRGHWVLTEYGNTWVSDYPWGWATFHYGRWRFDDYYGWEWIPGYEWAPAWVSWRQGGGYYGWAPLTPGISINISIGGGYNIPNDYWVFAPQAYITSPYIYNYYVPHTRVVNIIRNATVINNYYSVGNQRYVAGPRVQDIERVTRRSPEIYRINNSNRPGAVNISNNTVNIYRPTVRRAPDARPDRVVDGNAYKQQNPDQRIARRGQSGAAAYNHDNASRLAEVARSNNPNNNVVRVNNRPDNNRSGNRNDQNRPGQNNVQPGNVPNNNQPGNRYDQNRVQPGSTPNNNQPDNRFGQGNRNDQNRPGQNNAQPGNTPNNNQSDNRFGQPGNRGSRGRPEDRPNVVPQNNNVQPVVPAQPTTPAQPDNRPDNNNRQRRGADGGFNRQGQNDAAVQQQAQQEQQQRQQAAQQDAQRQQQVQQQQNVQRQQQEAQRQQQDARRQQMMQQQQDVQRQQQVQQQQDARRQQQQDVQRQQQAQQQQNVQRQQQEAQRQQDVQRQQQAQQQQNVQRQQQEAQRQQDAQRQQQAQQQQNVQRQQQEAQRQQVQPQPQQEQPQRRGRPAREAQPQQ